jgi:hypothetical protein
MSVIKNVIHSAGRWGVIIVLCSFASNAWAVDKTDWLDEMPCIPLVVQAVRENLRDLRSDVRLDDDEDERAADIVGTLMLLRWIMYFNVVEEVGVPMPRSVPKQQQTRWLLENYAAGLERMSKQRLAKFEALDAAYMQAEIVIGRGAGKRSGHLTTVRMCNTSDSYSARMADPKMGCYRYWFYIDFGYGINHYEHRSRILPKLFPSDRAKQYVELVTRYSLAAASPGDLAATLSMPPGSAYPMPGQDYCTTNHYGGDRNGNGLCDDWEKPLSKTATAGSSTGGNNVVCKGGDVATSSAASLDFDLTFGNAEAVTGYCPAIPRRNALAWLNPSPAALSASAAANAKAATSKPASTSPVQVVSSRTDPNAKAVDIDLGTLNMFGYESNFKDLTRQNLDDAGLPLRSCVISAHGSPDGVSYLNPKVKNETDLVKEIMSKCSPDEPVVLLACETGRPKTAGAAPFAQQLSVMLKLIKRQVTTVWAPNTLIKTGGSLLPNPAHPDIVLYERWFAGVNYYPDTPIDLKPEFIPYDAK